MRKSLMLCMPAGTLLTYEAFCTMPIDHCGSKFCSFGEVRSSSNLSFTLQQKFKTVLSATHFYFCVNGL